MLIPASLKEPIDCHTFVKVSIVVSAPVVGSTTVVPDIIVVMTKIRMGITKHTPNMIYTSGIVNILLKSTFSILVSLLLKL